MGGTLSSARDAMLGAISSSDGAPPHTGSDSADFSVLCAEGRRNQRGGLVRWRRSSLYLDEDGDTAHAFYEQVASRAAPSRTRMRRVPPHTLTPLGCVPYNIPRLNTELGIVMYQL